MSRSESTDADADTHVDADAVKFVNLSPKNYNAYIWGKCLFK